MGRPRRNLAKKHYPMLEEWWEQGMSVGDMARKLDMSETTLRAILKRDPKAEKHWQWGRGRRESRLWRDLHNPGIKNKTPTIYELKSRFGYTDLPRPKPQEEEPRVKVEVRLPAPLGEKDYRRLAEQWSAERAIDVTPSKELTSGGGEASEGAS